VFLREIPPMWLMGLVLVGGYLVCFVRFCCTFCGVLAAGLSGEGGPGGLGAEKRAGAFRRGDRSGGDDGFSDVLFHGICSLSLLCAFGG
jgi:hypothetical protein